MEASEAQISKCSTAIFEKAFDIFSSVAYPLDQVVYKWHDPQVSIISFHPHRYFSCNKKKAWPWARIRMKTSKWHKCKKIYKRLSPCMWVYSPSSLKDGCWLWGRAAVVTVWNNGNRIQVLQFTSTVEIQYMPRSSSAYHQDMIMRLFKDTFRELNYTRGDSAGGEF